MKTSYVLFYLKKTSININNQKSSHACTALLIVIFILLISFFLLQVFKKEECEDKSHGGEKSMPSNNSFQLQSHKNHHQMNITVRYAIFQPHFSSSSSIIDIYCCFSHHVDLLHPPNVADVDRQNNFICGASNSQRDEKGMKFFGVHKSMRDFMWHFYLYICLFEQHH